LDPQNNEFEAFYRLNRAKNWPEFLAALKTYGGPTQNFVYADVKGHIGWYAAGKVPIRRKGSGAVPYEASSRDGDWIGYIPFAKLPHLFDPPSGLIVTANQRTVSTDYEYPQFTRAVALPYRARRIIDRLSAIDKVTQQDAASVQLDAFSIPLDLLAKDIVRRKAASAQTLSLFANWNGEMTPDGHAGLVADEIRNCAALEIAKANPPLTYQLIRERIVDRAIREDLTRWLPAGFQNFDELLSRCDTSVRQSLTRRMGSNPSDWKWGSVFTATFPHPLVAAPVIGSRFATPTDPLAGSRNSPNVGSAVSMRFITTPGLWNETHLVIPLGESGSSRSTFFKDQFPMWKTNTPPPLVFSSELVDQLGTDIILSPKPGGGSRYSPKNPRE
jgi:penicillin amidase